MPEAKNLHIDSALTTFSVQYKNADLIWPAIMPMVKVGKRSDKYFVYDKAQYFRLPDDKISPKGLPNEIDMSVSNDNYSVKDHALSEYVTQEEIDNADTPLSPQLDAVEVLSANLHTAQEKRVVDLVFNPASYPTANKTQLSGNSQWGGSSDDPIGSIMTGLETAFMRPNTLVFGADTWKKFRQLPEILDAVKSSTRQQSTPGGLASAPEVAALFEVDQVLVGRARYTSTREGQTPSYTRLWGKHCALLYVNPKPGIRSVTFGVTFVETYMQTFTDFDGRRGVKGAQFIKNAWNSDEKLIAADTGYFIQDAVA